jgi:hypothetical protein
MGRLFFAFSFAMFLVGTGSLYLTLYVWFGSGPEQARSTVDHYRSVAENTVHVYSEDFQVEVYRRQLSMLSDQETVREEPLSRCSRPIISGSPPRLGASTRVAGPAECRETTRPG